MIKRRILLGGSREIMGIGNFKIENQLVTMYRIVLSKSHSFFLRTRIA